MTSVFVDERKRKIRVDELSTRIEELTAQVSKSSESAAVAHQRAAIMEVLLVSLISTGVFARESGVLSIGRGVSTEQRQQAIVDSLRSASVSEPRQHALPTPPYSEQIPVQSGLVPAPAVRSERVAEMYLGGIEDELRTRRSGRAGGGRGK